MTKQLKIKPCSWLLRPGSWTGHSSGLLSSFPFGVTLHLSLLRADQELVLAPFPHTHKIKAGHTDHKVVKLGVGERELRERTCSWVTREDGRLRRRHPGGDPRCPGPEAVPFGLCNENDAPGPREELSRRRSGAAGQRREPRGTAWVRGAPVYPGYRAPPAASGPCSPRPGIRRAGKEENNTTEGPPRLPGAARTRGASFCPVTMGGRGKKG